MEKLCDFFEDNVGRGSKSFDPLSTADLDALAKNHRGANKRVLPANQRQHKAQKDY